MALKPADQLEGQCREELKVVVLPTPQGITLMNIFAQVPANHTVCGRFAARIE